MRDDHGFALLGDLADDIPDQVMVNPGLRHLFRRRLRNACVAEALDHAPQQRSTLFGARDDVGVDPTGLRRARNGLLVEVAVPELLGHEPSDHSPCRPRRGIQTMRQGTPMTLVGARERCPSRVASRLPPRRLDLGRRPFEPGRCAPG